MFEHWPYLGVFIVLLAAGLGSPIPEDIPLLTGGYLCAADLAQLRWMIPVGIAGVLAGDLCLFTFARILGHRIVEYPLTRRLVNPSRLVLAESLFARHGVKIIFAGRFLPGLRPMIFAASGVLKVPYRTFLAVNGMAACISVPIVVMLGMFFGNHIEQIQGRFRTATHVIVLAAATALLIIGGIYLHKRRRYLATKVELERGIDAAAIERVVSTSTDPGDATDPADSSESDALTDSQLTRFRQ